MLGWELVNNNTHRIRVPGGWIVRTFMIRDESTLVPPQIAGGKPTKVVYDRNPTNVALCFVPDQEHAWVVPEVVDPSSGQN